MSLKITGELPSGTTNPAPEIECFIPEENPTGTGLVLFPGGGYWQLMDHEGDGYAEWLSARGVACFVVTYRLAQYGHRHPAMLEDALAAIRAVRSRAAEFGIQPNRIGVCGSSAGGHLAATALTLHGLYESDIPLRPDFGVLCYAVIQSTGEHAEPGSIKNLLGENPDPELLELMNCQNQVTPNTPPCFIWSTGEDVVVPVENSLSLAAALSAHNVPYDLRIYHQGKHGLGLETSHKWEEDLLTWMTKLGL